MSYDFYKYLSLDEIEKFKKEIYVCSGMIGLLYYEIANDLASHGSFQGEIAEVFNMSIDEIAGHGKVQYECAERLINSYTMPELISALKSYGVIQYSVEYDCYFPDFTSYNRQGRDYYVEVEIDNEL